MYRAARLCRANRMVLSDFDYDLPEALIALRPAVPRPASRLLVSDKSGISDARVADLGAVAAARRLDCAE